MPRLVSRCHLLALTLLAASGFARANAGESSGSLSSIAEREVARRQALLATAAERLAEGQRLLAEGKNAEATSILLETYRSLPEAPIADQLRNASRDAYATAACAHAQDLLNEASYTEAHQVLDTVLSADVSPKHAAATRLKKQAMDTDRYQPALTPDHIAKVKQVNELLIYANSAFTLGDYDKALKTYESVLKLDITNSAARRGMERVERSKAEYYKSAYDHTRSRMLSEVTANWEENIPPSAAKTLEINAGRIDSGTISRGRRDKIAQKLRTLRMAKVDFSAASLDEVIEYLRITSRDLDPEGQGINFILNVSDESKVRTLSLNLQDMPMEEVLRYVTELAGVASRIEDAGVVVSSLTEKATSLISKTYRVPPDFIQSADATPAAGAAGSDPFAANAGAPTTGLLVKRMGAKEFLQARGVAFNGDATATFSPATSTLVVRNTAENIALIDTLVEQSVQNAPKQAYISVKIIEVNEQLLSDIHNEVQLGAANVPGSDRNFFSGGTLQGSTTDGIRSTGAILGSPGLEELLALGKNQNIPAKDSQSPAAIQLFGALTDPQFSVMAHLLHQKTGSDLVSMPSVVARSGQKASVVISREFPYPTEFDPPEIPQAFGINPATNAVTGVNGAAPITPTTPTTFEVKNLGTVLEVEPLISADGRTVDLVITPTNTEFEGFVDYGSDMRNADYATVTDLFTGFLGTAERSSWIIDNPIVQPVFRKSSITTSVTIWDGSTIILGGVISEKIQDINDKVPVVGDIPLVGRLWQGKVKQSLKKCVLMFVTVKVIEPGGHRVNAPEDINATAAAGQ